MSRQKRDNTGLSEDCGCIYAPGLGGHITTHCREGHTPTGPRCSLCNKRVKILEPSGVMVHADGSGHEGAEL